MKAIMLTIKLKYFYLTYKGIKTIEVRKSCPKSFVVDVYEVISKTNFEKDLMEIPENEREFFKQFKGKVGLKFTLNKVEEIRTNLAMRFFTESANEKELLKKSCLNSDQLFWYLAPQELKIKCCGYSWHISNLEIFDKPKELSEFKNYKKFVSYDYTYTKKYVDWELRPLTKAPQSWCYVEIGELE